jgi:hypothetical protein
VVVQEALMERGLPSVNVPEAIVYKVPAGSPRDFSQTTRRTRGALAGQRVGPRIYLAALLEGLRHPLGATMYVLYRAYGAIASRRLGASANREMWDPVASTKRR